MTGYEAAEKLRELIAEIDENVGTAVLLGMDWRNTQPYLVVSEYTVLDNGYVSNYNHQIL